MTAYQGALKGFQPIDVMGEDLKEEVDKVLYNPPDKTEDAHLMPRPLSRACGTNLHLHPMHVPALSGVRRRRETLQDQERGRHAERALRRYGDRGCLLRDVVQFAIRATSRSSARR